MPNPAYLVEAPLWQDLKFGTGELSHGRNLQADPNDD
jgi:hypothetical protein